MKKEITAEEVQNTLQTALDVVEEKLQTKIDSFAENHSEDIENLNKHKTSQYVLHIVTFVIASLAHIL